MSQSWPISWWEYTGRMTEFVDGISSPILCNLATGQELTYRDLPMGACWAVSKEMAEHYQKGVDGLSIMCKVPATGGAHHWRIDGRASNCDSPCATCGAPYRDHLTIAHPYVDSRPNHRCWVRHGTVGEKLHIDKAGDTCGAGAGSIQTDGWHGFLHNGVLGPT